MALERECEKCGRKVQSRRFCNTCRSREFRENKPTYQRDYRRTPEYMAKDKARSAAFRPVGLKIVADAKDVPCADCGGTFPACCMDFDHIPERGEKKFNLSKVGTRKLETILAEIAKCDVICANCHRLRTRARAEARGNKGMV